MHVAKRIVSLAFVSLLSLGAARNAAADAKEAMEQLKALNQSAASAYQDGDFEKTKSQLQEAISLAKMPFQGFERKLSRRLIAGA